MRFDSTVQIKTYSATIISFPFLSETAMWQVCLSEVCRQIVPESRSIWTEDHVAEVGSASDWRHSIPCLALAFMRQWVANDVGDDDATLSRWCGCRSTLTRSARLSCRSCAANSRSRKLRPNSRHQRCARSSRTRSTSSPNSSTRCRRPSRSQCHAPAFLLSIIYLFIASICCRVVCEVVVTKIW